MAKSPKSKGSLQKRGLAAVDTIVGGKDETNALKICRVSPQQFGMLLNNADFANQVRQRITGSAIRTELLIAQYGQVAAAKLIGLTECDKEETGRKACLDVIELLRKGTQETMQKKEVESIVHASGLEMTPTQASRVLALLAEEETEDAQK